MATIHASILLNISRVWARYDNRNNQVVGRLPVRAVAPCNSYGQQWRTALVNRQVDFSSLFIPVRWIRAGFFPAQQCRTVFAIHRLPFWLAREQPQSYCSRQGGQPAARSSRPPPRVALPCWYSPCSGSSAADRSRNTMVAKEDCGHLRPRMMCRFLQLTAPKRTER